MPDQLSLFPVTALHPEVHPGYDMDANATDEMFYACRHFRSSAKYFDLLHFIARFPKYSAFNGLLLYLQNPDITYTATAANWWRRFRRKPKYGVAPLMILAPMSPVLFVYDIDDTEGEPVSPKQLRAFDSREGFSKEVFEKTIQNAAFHGISIRYFPRSRLASGTSLSLTYEVRKHYGELTPEPWAKYLVALDPKDPVEEKYAGLAMGLSHIFCGHLGIDDKSWWQDRREADPVQAAVEAESSACLICLRRGLVKAAGDFLIPYNEGDREMPVFGLNSVLNATHYIEEMGKSRWKGPKRKSRYKPE